ncbi:MAG: hypothetical protein AABW51_05520 [Nanoarchaeota archaeon]
MMNENQQIKSETRDQIILFGENFGKRCLDYFYSLHLQEFKKEYFKGLSGNLPLDEDLKVKSYAKGLFTKINYNLLIIPNLRGIDNTDKKCHIWFNINLLQEGDPLNGLRGWIKRDGVKTQGELDLSGKRVLKLSQKFLEEMVKASEAILG